MQTQQFLQGKGQSITTLHEKYKIRSSTHPDQSTFPLIVLNYDNIQSPREEVIVGECRGLVLELNSWKIVARGMPRFFNQQSMVNSCSSLVGGLKVGNGSLLFEQDHSPSLEKSKLFDYSNFSMETKEDGTFLLLFCYEGEWMIATRHNFCEDYLGIGTETGQKTYRELFVEICGGLELNEVGKDLDSSMTYCLEMCSSQNEIVQIYQNPVIYLLTIVQTQSGKELSKDQVDKACLKLRGRNELINWKRPKRFENFSSLEKALNHLDLFISSHENADERLRIEGFIMRDVNNQRLKLKNPFYLLIHKMKYRGWIQATPKFLIPFIVHFEEYNKSKDSSHTPFIISVLKKYYECEFEMNELETRYQYCNTILQKEFTQLESLWSICENMSLEDFDEFKKDRSVSNRTKLFDLIVALKQGPENSTLPQILKSNSNFIIAQLFTSQSQMEAFESNVMKHRTSKHSSNYCQPNKKQKVTENNSGLAKTKPFLDKKTNQYRVQCYCGKPMVLKRLKRDFVQYRKCHCGKSFDVHTYKVGTLLYQCSDYPKCLLNHEVHQRDEMFSDEKIQYFRGQPLGIPSSELCKIYRLQIHEIMTLLMKKNNWKKSKCYQLIAEWLKVEKSQAHVALFSIETCLFIISKFIDNYNIYNQ